jgi:hypothetical protein
MGSSIGPAASGGEEPKEEGGLDELLQARYGRGNDAPRMGVFVLGKQ